MACLCVFGARSIFKSTKGIYFKHETFRDALELHFLLAFQSYLVLSCNDKYSFSSFPFHFCFLSTLLGILSRPNSAQVSKGVAIISS